MNEQISTIQTREVMELMRNLAPILNQKELFEFMLFSNRVLKRYMPEHYNDGLSEEVTEMRKDKEWLRDEVSELYPSYDEMYVSPDYETVAKTETISKVLELIDQLDEPETLSQEWIDENKVERIDNLRKITTSDVVPVEKLKNLLVPKQDDGFVVFEKDKLDEEVQRMIDETCEATNEKPVIPQFVADWIERKKQPDWDYENKEDALADSIHFTLYSLKANYREANPDVVLRKPINEWLNDDRKNYWKLIDGVRYGYEVEKEKKYRVRAGNRYVRFNLDGSIIGVKKDNSNVCLERLSKLPFDYKKAVESGIITLEEVTE